MSLAHGRLPVNGHEPAKDFIAQALKNTYWLRDEIRQTITVEVWITPVLVFTNASVERTTPIKGVTMVNRKYLLSLLNRPNAKLRNLSVWENREKIISALYVQSAGPSVGQPAWQLGWRPMPIRARLTPGRWAATFDAFRVRRALRDHGNL